MPTSSSTRTAIGWTRQGFDPALSTMVPAGAIRRARASASWLRAEFATQRNTTVRGTLGSRLATVGADSTDLAGDAPERVGSAAPAGAGRGYPSRLPGTVPRASRNPVFGGDSRARKRPAPPLLRCSDERSLLPSGCPS